MDQKDRDRLKVLHEVEQGHLTQVQAGEQLGLSERWIRKLLKRKREEGDRGIVNRLRDGCRFEGLGQQAFGLLNGYPGRQVHRLGIGLQFVSS